MLHCKPTMPQWPLLIRESRATSNGLLLPLVCCLAMHSAQAARPMATDDTATAAAGECQIEVWGERVDDERSQVLAPACGLTDTLELDTAVARIQGGSATANSAVVGLKWVPTAAAWKSALGTVRAGMAGGVSWDRPSGERWKAGAVYVIALGSLEFAPAWNLYANVLTTRDLDTGKHVDGLRTALAWKPGERVLLFVEDLRASGSRSLQNAGFRLWAIPKVLGLDVVTTRPACGGLTLNVGIGWYGIQLP